MLPTPVTSISLGIGRAICEEYLKKQWAVIGSCRRENFPAELEKLGVLGFPNLDVRDMKANERVVENLKRQNVKIYLLVNNAGAPRKDSLENLDFEAIKVLCVE